MAVTTKRVTREVILCDSCRDAIDESAHRTHITAQADGFYKKEAFEFDLCVQCGDKFGLKRRGRRPSTTESKPARPRATRKARAVQAEAPAEEQQMASVGAAEDW